MQSRMGSNMPFLFESDFEGESSLNPYALEFIPSYLKRGKSDNGKKILKNKQAMKNEATSTTTLVQREAAQDAFQRRNAKRQLFKIMHQMGEQLVPLKSINISLSTDGHSINVLFKAHHPLTAKQMLDESLCNDSALKLDMDDCAFIPRRLPNVLAAKFMMRMGDILNDKIKWVEEDEETISTSSSTNASQLSSSGQLLDTKSSMGSKPSMDSKISSENKLLTKKKAISRSMEMLAQTTSNDSTSTIANKARSSMSGDNGTFKSKPFAETDTKLEKPSNKGINSPRQSLGQIVKKGITGKTFLPRSTHTSQMRQSQVQKRLSLLK